MTKITGILKNVFSILVLTIVGFVGLTSISNISGNAQRLPGVGRDSADDVCPPTGCRVLDPSRVDSLPELAGNIAALLAFVIASIAIIFVLYGAFIWLSDQEKGAERGRKIITNAVIALVIAVVSFGVIQALINFLSTFQVNE